jgi:hypothetical protein
MSTARATRVALVVGIALVAAIANGCGDRSAEAPPADGAGAGAERIGDRPMGEGELERFLLREAGVFPDDLEAEVLASFRADLVAEILLARAASREGLDVDPAALDEETERLVTLAPDVDRDALSDEARRRLLARAYEMRIIAPRVAVPAAEIDRALETNGAARRVKHVVFRQLMVPTRSEAETARRRIVNDGEAFEAVAQDVSLEASAGKPQQRRLDELPEEAASMLTRLREGRISPPVALAGVYYVFKLETVTHDPDPGRERERQEVHHRLLQAAFERERHATLQALAAEEGVPADRLPQPPAERP